MLKMATDDTDAAVETDGSASTKTDCGTTVKQTYKNNSRWQ